MPLVSEKLFPFSFSSFKSAFFYSMSDFLKGKFYTSVSRRHCIFIRTQLTRLAKKNLLDTYFWETLDQTKGDRFLFCRNSKQDFTSLTCIKTLMRVKMFSKLLTHNYFFIEHLRDLCSIGHTHTLEKHLFLLIIPTFISPNYLLSKINNGLLITSSEVFAVLVFSIA